jgi:rRNA maturation protein Nop10
LVPAKPPGIYSTAQVKPPRFDPASRAAEILVLAKPHGIYATAQAKPLRFDPAGKAAKNCGIRLRRVEDKILAKFCLAKAEKLARPP